MTTNENYLNVVVRELKLVSGEQYHEVLNAYAFYEKDVQGFASDGSGTLTVLLNDGTVKIFGAHFIESVHITDYVWFARLARDADTQLRRAMFG